MYEAETFSFRAEDSFNKCYENDLCISINGIELNDDKASFSATIIIDSDRDGCANDEDAFPDDPNECLDNDMDGIGDNADTDDDNDGMPDEWEDTYGFDSKDASDANSDFDNDGVSNLAEYQNGTDPTVAPQVTPPAEPESSGGGGTLNIFFILFVVLFGLNRNVVNRDLAK